MVFRGILLLIFANILEKKFFVQLKLEGENVQKEDEQSSILK